MLTTDTNPASVPADDLTSLMASIRGGSESALGRLMELCWAELVRYAASQLSDVELSRDVVQEAFIQVWERRRAWRPRGSARVYLYRIVRNLVIDQKRRQAVRRRWLTRQGREDAVGGAHAATPAEVLDAKMLADAFQVAVASLPDRRREVFELVFPAWPFARGSGRGDERFSTDRGQPDVFRAAHRQASRGVSRGLMRPTQGGDSRVRIRHTGRFG